MDLYTFLHSSYYLILVLVDGIIGPNSMEEVDEYLLVFICIILVLYKHILIFLFWQILQPCRQIWQIYMDGCCQSINTTSSLAQLLLWLHKGTPEVGMSSLLQSPWD